MNVKLTYLICALAATGLCASCSNTGSKNPRLPVLTETFSKKDKNPFGGFIAYQQVKELYRSNTVRDKKLPFNKTWESISDTAALYICITPALFVNEEEVDAMLEYVEDGNDLFIAARYIDENLLKRINCKTKMGVALQGLQKTNTRSLIEPGSPYSYFYYPFNNYFLEIDTGRTRIVGHNEEMFPNSIVYFYGNGKLYLQCDPRAYSNYFLLKDSNYRYLQHSLAFTAVTPQHVYWDDYYNKLRFRRDGKTGDKSFSSFSEILKHPPLAYAFWLSLLLLALYILFSSKRVQRIIEQVKPNENTTLTFTETIGRLYLQKKDNKNISDKMITYFNEFIRNKYFLNTNQVTDDFIDVLSRKSGVQKDNVDSLYRSIADAQASAVINDYQLLSLNEQIQNFHKTKK